MTGFSVLQWNIDYTEPIDKIVDYVALHSPDVICLQEVTQGIQQCKDTAAYVAEQLGYTHTAAYGEMTLPTGQSAKMGVGIFSKWPIVDKKQIPIQERVGDIGDERYYLECTIAIGDTTARVGTMHLPFNPYFRTTAAKRQMVETVLANVPSNRPYILAADLNSVPNSIAAKMLRLRLAHAGPALTIPTWTTKPFHIGPFSYEQLRWRLDYILYQGVRQLSAERLQADVSDHCPLLARFRFG